MMHFNLLVIKLEIPIETGLNMDYNLLLAMNNKLYIVP